MLKEYDDMKEQIKNLKTQTVYRKVLVNVIVLLEVQKITEYKNPKIRHIMEE